MAKLFSWPENEDKDENIEKADETRKDLWQAERITSYNFGK